MRILLLLLALALPLWAAPLTEPAPVPVPNRAQLEQLRGVLNRYTEKLMVLDQQRQILGRMRALVTPEQEAVIRQLRVTPQQSVQLIELLREVLPQVALQNENTGVLKERLMPRVLQIIGPEQADLLMQLTPSPQQAQQMQALLQESQAVWQASLGPLQNELMAELMPLLQGDQRQWLEYFQGLLKRTEVRTAPLEVK